MLENSFALPFDEFCSSPLKRPAEAYLIGEDVWTKFGLPPTPPISPTSSCCDSDEEREIAIEFDLTCLNGCNTEGGKLEANANRNASQTVFIHRPLIRDCMWSIHNQDREHCKCSEEKEVSTQIIDEHKPFRNHISTSSHQSSLTSSQFSDSSTFQDSQCYIVKHSSAARVQQSQSSEHSLLSTSPECMKSCVDPSVIMPQFCCSSTTKIFPSSSKSDLEEETSLPCPSTPESSEDLEFPHLPHSFLESQLSLESNGESNPFDFYLSPEENSDDIVTSSSNSSFDQPIVLNRQQSNSIVDQLLNNSNSFRRRGYPVFRKRKNSQRHSEPSMNASTEQHTYCRHPNSKPSNYTDIPYIPNSRISGGGVIRKLLQPQAKSLDSNVKNQKEQERRQLTRNAALKLRDILFKDPSLRGHYGQRSPKVTLLEVIKLSRSHIEQLTCENREIEVSLRLERERRRQLRKQLSNWSASR